MKNSNCVLFLLAILALFSNCYQCDNIEWIQLNPVPVCLSGKNNNPGTFHALHSGFVAAIKLVRVSGQIRCGSGSKHNSFFGCHLRKGLEKYPLNVVVTNAENKIKFPISEVDIKQPNKAYWYGLDGVNSKSKEIVLQHGFDHPYFVYMGQLLRVWYGEDLMNQWEGNNVGRVCVDVLGYFM